MVSSEESAGSSTASAAEEHWEEKGLQKNGLGPRRPNPRERRGAEAVKARKEGLREGNGHLDRMAERKEEEAERAIRVEVLI